MGSIVASAVAPVVGSIISGIFGQSSAKAQNRANREEAQRNRAFQERMSSTAHQRQVKDLRAAGLNPILSATGGSGSSSPSGNLPTMVNEGQAGIDNTITALNTALSLKKQNAEIKNIGAATNQVEATTVLTTAQAEKAAAEAAAYQHAGKGIKAIDSMSQILGTNTAKAQLAIEKILGNISTAAASKPNWEKLSPFKKGELKTIKKHKPEYMPNKNRKRKIKRNK